MSCRKSKHYITVLRSGRSGRLRLVRRALGIAVIVLLPIPLSAQQRSAGIVRLEGWLSGVESHVPGHKDDALGRIRLWVNSDVDLLTPYLEGLLALLPPEEDSRVARTRPRMPASVTREEIDELLKLAAQNPAKRGRTELLKRAAVLHADVMMSGLARDVRVDSDVAARRSAGASGRIVTLGKDGQYEGYAVEPPHWRFARWMLDRVEPAPPAAEFMRLWYRATTAYMLLTGRWSAVETHLRHALEHFPEDAGLHFDLGCTYEGYASPRLQGIMQSARSSNARVPRDSAPPERLRQAEAEYARAIALDPALIEARVRHARVTALLGRGEQAARDLRALTASNNPIVDYYAAMFLGDIERTLGNREAAADAFRRAAALYPRAQSPHLALSLLAVNGGDRSTALSALQRILALPADERLRADPWWDYHLGIGRSAEAIVGMLWRALEPPS